MKKKEEKVHIVAQKKYFQQSKKNSLIINLNLKLNKYKLKVLKIKHKNKESELRSNQ